MHGTFLNPATANPLCRLLATCDRLMMAGEGIFYCAWVLSWGLFGAGLVSEPPTFEQAQGEPLPCLVPTEVLDLQMASIRENPSMAMVEALGRLQIHWPYGMFLSCANR